MKSYFTFLGRNKLYTAIQFFGLAIALGVVILLTSYADTELISVTINRTLTNYMLSAMEMGSV